MSFICDHCKEDFERDEVILLNGENSVLLEEEGGSGDYDNCYCHTCDEERFGS